MQDAGHAINTVHGKMDLDCVRSLVEDRGGGGGGTPEKKGHLPEAKEGLGEKGKKVRGRIAGSKMTSSCVWTTLSEANLFKVREQQVPATIRLDSCQHKQKLQAYQLAVTCGLAVYGSRTSSTTPPCDSSSKG